MFFNTNPISKIQKRSDKHLSIFTKTVNNLTKVNEQANTHINDREVQIAKLNEEKDNLHAIVKGNKAVIDKINKIFE